MVDIEANLRRVRERIAEAALRKGRRPEDITLVAVTKTIDPERILIAARLGVKHFGENRVQEALRKIPVVNQALGTPPTWHMVGHLQTNKVRKALGIFDFIHSVDSVRLAREINKRAGRESKVIPILLEVNISGEATKFGFAPEEVEDAVREILSFPNLSVQGLMTIAPIVNDPEEARPFFRRLRELRDYLAEQFPQIDWKHLSMGMTDDFEVAIEEGATMVRLGRAIFGERR
ncbi:MAG TPA: YggS family pyridoxal phosphate-dependent enzyme [Chloroflexi bacterium]|nr:YggS family pyridoxal phosphate-dependent enzyme [Chloroflexota bacterium]